MTPTQDDALRAAWVLKDWCDSRTCFDTDEGCSGCCFVLSESKRICVLTDIDEVPYSWPIPPKPATLDKWDELRKWARWHADNSSGTGLYDPRDIYLDVVRMMYAMEGDKTGWAC